MTKQDKIIINQLVVSQIKRESVDINKWRSALRKAESLLNPNRSDLYDIYHDVLLDTHLSSVIQKRKTAILNAPIVFLKEGKQDENIDVHFSSPWFRSMLSDLIDTIFWGYSVMQFYKEQEWINYDLIPRKHIRPETGILVKSQGDQDGIPYRDGGYPNIIEAGQINDFGLLCKAAPWVIYKRNCMSDYAQFAELFGQPIREGTYDAFDDMARDKLRNDLETMGGSSIFIHPDNTQIKLIETTQKSTGSSLYKDLMTFCNAELSKLILGNTLTTEQGDKGARSLGEIHRDGENQLLNQDKQFILDILNYDLQDILINLGINTTGGEFMFEDKEEYDLKEKVMIDMQIASKVPVGDDYWYETYGIPKPDDYEAIKKETAEKTAQEPPPSPGGRRDGDEVAKTLRSFFSNALGRRAPLEF